MIVNNSSVLIQTLMFVMNQSSIQQDDSYNYYYLQIGKTTNATKCYGIYGCFTLGPPWTSEHRPVSVFPQDFQEIEPRFLLYSKRNLQVPTELDLNEFDVIGSSGIDPYLPLYVISHGYMEGGNIYWILETVTELLKLKDCSIMVVDWQKGAVVSYTQAVANIRLIGAMTAHVLRDLAEHIGEKQMNVHCIGHSLGAHLCGYVGYTLQSFGLTLDRITGLDPAEPHFAYTDRPVRLDKSAARYVDIIHTDAGRFIRGALGITARIGHVDYFPNGGKAQPACAKNFGSYVNDEESFFIGAKKWVGCNHLKSHEYFVESINPQKCSYETVTCSSYKDFSVGKCFDCGNKREKCIRFGYHGREDYERLVNERIIEPDTNVAQYLRTGDTKPYCRGHYKVTVNVSNSEESISNKGEDGHFVFTLHSTKDRKGPKSNPVSLKHTSYYMPGGNYTGILAADEVSDLKGVEVQWIHETNLLNPLTWRILSVAKIYITSITIESLELKQRVIVCPKETIALENWQTYFMLPSYCRNEK